MEKEKLLAELEKEFNTLRDKLNFSSSFEQIDEICFLRDYILSSGFVSSNLYAQLVNRLVESYYSWTSVIHSWIMPPQYDLIYLNESKKLNEFERKELKSWLIEVMYLVRKNKEIAFQESPLKGEFIDELVKFNENHEKVMVKYNKKFKEYWDGEKSPSIK